MAGRSGRGDPARAGARSEREEAPTEPVAEMFLVVWPDGATRLVSRSLLEEKGCALPATVYRIDVASSLLVKQRLTPPRMGWLVEDEKHPPIYISDSGPGSGPVLSGDDSPPAAGTTTLGGASGNSFFRPSS